MTHGNSMAGTEEGMGIEDAAQVAIVSSLVSLCFASIIDRADLLVSAMCGALPCVAFLAMCNSGGNEERTAVLFWVSVSSVFIVTFIRVMLGVVEKVKATDMDRLLKDTMSIFCTGVVSSHVVFVCFSVGGWGAVSATAIGALCTAALAGQAMAWSVGPPPVFLGCIALACVVPCAGAIALEIASARAVAGAAIAFVVACRLDTHSRFVALPLSWHAPLACVHCALSSFMYVFPAGCNSFRFI